jgi:membrane protein DedA with SNARE-associated domain
VHFAFFDSVAALVSAPVFVYLGYRFGGELEMLITAVRHGQTRVLLGLVVAIALYLLLKRAWRQRRAQKMAATQVAAVGETSTQSNALRSQSKV